MLDKPDRSCENDDDVQMAAALAAVYAYIAAEEESASHDCAGHAKESGWAPEALLEATALVAQIGRPLPAAVKKNPWFGAGLKFVLSLSLGAAAFFGTSAGAQVRYGEMPPVAPAQATAQQQSAAPLPSLLLRVGIVPEAQTITLGVPDGADVCDRASGTVVARLAGQGRWTVAARTDTLAFTASNQQSTASILPSQQPVRPVGFRSPAVPPASAFSLKIPVVAVKAAAPGPTWTTAQGQSGSTGQAPALRSQQQAPVGPGAGGYVVVPPQPDGLVAVNGRLYRGIVCIQPCVNVPGKVAAINVIDLEDYLLSVVPAEMPGGWPLEALKAQAIVARSYALANRGKNESRGFDVKATVEDQVYSGVSSEAESTNRAVAETAGIIIEHQGKPAAAFFHSTSGGFTELAEFVWGGSAPFLQAVPDYDDASPHFSWIKRFSLADLDKALAGAAKDTGEVIGVFVVSRAPSMRARQVLVVGNRDSKLMGADAVRRLLKLPSTNFNVGYLADCYEFAGRGFGHGLGMSQWGAKALAERGYNAAQILKYYYKDVVLDYHEAISLSDGGSTATSVPSQ